jgi:predicted nucleic acid-binding protein
MIFVDTGAWFASMVPWDAHHAAATAWLAQNREPLLTTDYIADETLTLFRLRGEGTRGLRFGSELFGGLLASLYLLSPGDIDEAWQTYHSFHDKEWSFTDCTCKVVMERLGIKAAFSFDRHFHQFGTVTVVP